MKKRIYFNMLMLAFCSILLTSAFLITSFYFNFASQIKSELKNKAIFLERSLNLLENQTEYMELIDLPNAELRISLVNSNGTVLYDNVVTEESQLDSHLEREEIMEAMEYGVGDGNRLSESIGKETYYYALRLENGNVIRVSKMTSNIYGVFFNTLPQSILIIIIIFIISLVVVPRMSKNIIEPINKFDFENNPQIYDELSPFIRTITEQKDQINKALDEVTKKNTMIDAITMNMNEGLILINKDGVVLSANKSALSILNVRSVTVDKNILEITRNKDVLGYLKTALQGENKDIVMEIDSRIYHIFFSSVDLGALVLFLDVTEKAKLEKMRREFTANVSHELKTPLTTISGYAELLSKGMVKAEDIKEVSNKVKDESNRLIILIEDIMRLSELEETNDKKMFVKFNLTEIIDDVCEQLKFQAKKMMVSIIKPREDYYITANKQMIFEILYNLIDNGIKYNKPNGTVNISIVITDTDNKVRINVEDNGIGIDKSHHSRIFERFYRVDKSRSKKNGGTGLGLSIVKHIAAYHGGNVSFESESGKGTKVTVELPIL